MANQEREKLGLENPVVHDTNMAVQTAVDAVRNLIWCDKEKNNRRRETRWERQRIEISRSIIQNN